MRDASEVIAAMRRGADNLDSRLTEYVTPRERAVAELNAKTIRDWADELAATLPASTPASEPGAMAPAVTVARANYCHTARFTYDNNREGDAQWRDFYDLASGEVNERPVPQWLVRHLLGLPLVMK